jgi:hypothetical protein
MEIDRQAASPSSVPIDPESGEKNQGGPAALGVWERGAAEPDRQLGGKMPAAGKIQNIRNGSYGGPANKNDARPKP